MKREGTPESNPPSGSEEARFFARLRSKYQAVERDIMEEFPNWPKVKRTIRRWLALLFAVILISGAVIYIHQWRVQREQARRRLERAKVILLIDPLEEVQQETIEFVWRPSLIADHYVVELSDSMYHLLWRSEPVKEAEVKLPDHIRQKLTRGQVYLWQVRGLDQKENEVARSPFEHITIVR